MDILEYPTEVRELECAACVTVKPCVVVPITPWWDRPLADIFVRDQDREIHLCESCLTKAMLTIRPFSIVPKPVVTEEWQDR